VSGAKEAHHGQSCQWNQSAPRFAALLCAALLVGTVGCKEDAPKTDETPTDADTAPAKKMRWVESTPELVAKGKTTYGACMGCHGDMAEGRIGIGPRLKSETFLAAASDDFLINNIKEGRAGTTMVGWKTTFDDTQVQSLVAYLRSLEPTPAAELDEAPLKGDAVKGAELFRNVCSGCHGRNGGGYQETSNGTGIGRSVFLDKATNGFMRHIIKAGKSHTKMRGFGDKDPMAVANLSDADVENIIAHLRKNAW
jgi:mono/diheme cytochrome c family protein